MDDGDRSSCLETKKRLVFVMVLSDRLAMVQFLRNNKNAEWIAARLVAAIKASKLSETSKVGKTGMT